MGGLDDVLRDVARKIGTESTPAPDGSGRNLLDSLPVGILVADREGRVLLANRALQDAVAVPPEAAVGRTVSEVLPNAELSGRIVSVLRGSAPLQMEAIRVPASRPAGDRVLCVHVARVPLAGEPEDGLLVAVADVTEIAERQRFTRMQAAALEAVADAVLVTDTAGRIVMVNSGFVRHNGYTPEEALGRTPSILRSRDTPDEVYAELWRTILGGRPWRGELVNRRKDGTTYVAELTVAPILGADGRPEAFVGVHRDVTDRRRAEEALRRSERNFRTLIEHSPDAVAVHRDDRFVYVNPALARLLGWDAPADLVGRPVLEIVHPDDHDLVRRRIRTMWETGELAPPREVRLLRRDGRVVHVEVAAIGLEFEGAPAVVAVGRDLTERRELVARMMRMDRMVSVATLAAGVGHEINNPLTYVNANVGFALEHVDDLRAIALRLEAACGRGDAAALEADLRMLRERLDDIEEVLADAREGGERIRTIVRDLRTLSRGDDERSGPVDIHEVLEFAVRMANNEIRHRARLVRDWGVVPPVHGNASRLGQVFLNLLVNAAHAIPEGAAADNEIRLRSRLADGEVVVEITDTGCGIPPEHLPHLFEPFFTTKPLGQGTGLGLSICREIVEAHGGRIEVESQPGVGTTFRVRLPASLVDDDGDATQPTWTTMHGPRGRVAVVDDEPMVGRTVERALRHRHSVELLTARQLLELLDRGERYDLLLLDVMMPDCTGPDLYERIAARWPDQAERVVFLTGGAFTALAREHLERTARPCLDKPFQPDALRRFVDAALRGSDPES